MTERWRKKLEGIDRVGPSDDVYERAKAGPSLPEPQSPMRRTSTRVVTAIAAFVVFALAISVFAIPALRLGNKESFVPGGGQLQPLWPWNSIDAVQAWRDDPQPIGATSIDHFSSPEEVAAAFGQDVLGWTEVYPHEEGQTYPCTPPPGVPPGSSAGSDTIASPATIYACSVVYGGGSVPPTIALHGSTSAAPAFRTFDLSTCPPNMVCDSSGAPPSSVKVVVYQPLGGEGPWAVLESKTDYVSISLDPGTQLRNGSTAYAGGSIPNGEHAVLGYHATADGCGEHSDTSAFEVGTDTASDRTSGGLSFAYSRGQLQFTLPPQGDACRDQVGYVFVAITDQGLATTDPLGGIHVATGVLGFAAVPVSFLYLSEDAGSPPPSISSSTPSPVFAPDHGYTDPLGWTIDVPDGWSAHPIEMGTADESWRGAWFGTGQPADAVVPDPNRMSPKPGDVMVILDRHEHVGSNPPQDDSTLPLTFKQLAPIDGGYSLDFHADGQPFTLSVRVASDGFTDQQRATVERMVASIRFQPWEVGETRNGWTAVGQVLPDASAQWVTFQDEHWYATYDADGRRLFVGPAPRCSSGGSYEVRETGVVGVICPDGTGGDWDLQGHPRQGSSPGFDIPLDGYLAVLGWNGGTLLAQLPSSN